jgi:hypothetical protein
MGLAEGAVVKRTVAQGHSIGLDDVVLASDGVAHTLHAEQLGIFG